MAKRNRKQANQAQRETPREQRRRTRQQAKDRKFVLWGSAGALLALLAIGIGLFVTFVWVPNAVAFRVNGAGVTTDEFRRRYSYERQRMQERLDLYRLVQQQFGVQTQSQAEINRLQNYLRDAFSLGVRVKALMIEDLLIAEAARQAGIEVRAEEIEELLADEVAQRYEASTESQATATREAYAATAQTEETNASVPPTPPSAAVLSAADFQQGLNGLANDLRQAHGLSLEAYRGILRAGLLRNRMRERIRTEEVTATELQVRARHLLLAFTETDPEAVAGEAEPQVNASLPRAERTEAEAEALARSLLTRLEKGESFPYLVSQYSDDPSGEFNQGDLGWFGRDRLVPEFEAVAFALEPGQFSDPVKTEFGYHILKVLERNEEANRPLEAVQAETAEKFEDWLNDLRAQARIEERGNLEVQLPPGADREAEAFANASEA